MRRLPHLLLAPVALAAACWPGPHPTPLPDDPGEVVVPAPTNASGGEPVSGSMVYVGCERSPGGTDPVAGSGRGPGPDPGRGMGLRPGHGVGSGPGDRAHP